MTDLAQQISEFLGRRKAIVAEIINRGGEQEAALLKAYGAPTSVDAMVSGAQQGVMHGFADDMERAERGDGVARKHILARAARPVEYEVATLLGTMLAAGGLRFGLEAAGAQASAGARAGARVSGAAGGAQIAARNAERAGRIRQKFTTLGMKPQHRGTVMDAAHGAAWGYGGSDVRANEEGGFNPERLLRAGLGAAGSAVAAPLTSSAAVAASNIPLAFGGRRAFSKPMLEPPGVTRANPAGRPRDSIEIARTRDESAARGAGGPGLVARDMSAPIDSPFPHVQKLADQALAPIAPERIAALRAQERNAAANSMVAAYPDPAAARRIAPPQPARPLPARTPGADDLAQERAARGERPDPLANMREAQLLREAARREAMEAAQPQQGQLNLPEPVDEADVFVRQMMEGFVRQDRPALESWVATLEAASRKDPSVMPRVKAAVARQLAISERADPALNNTPVMREFLHALGLWGNKAKGTPNILEAARAPAREQFPTGRYEDALARTAKDTPMRPRHAERMRQEMDAFQPGPYTGPADARRGPPLVARGDDKPYWLNPLDFFREGKVNDGEVNMAGLLSGPASYLIEDKLVGPAAQFLIGSPEHVEQPGALADVQPQQAAALVPEEVMPPRRQQAPAMRQAPARSAPMRAANTAPAAPLAPAPPRSPAGPQRPEVEVIMDIQQAMIDAGIPVGGPDGLPDGIIGKKTRRAIELFTMGANRSLEDVLERIRSYPRDRLAQILSK